MAIVVMGALLAGCGRKQPASVERPAPGPITAQPETETVLELFVPCAFAAASGKIAKMFEQANPGVRVNRTVENVGTLVPRILDGAKPDVFMCIGDHEVNLLDEKGLVEYRKPFCFTSLVLVVPQANPAKISSLKDLVKPEVKTIALADDDRSAGYYARQLLEENGLWDKVKGKLVRPRFPIELLKLAGQGKVQASIAYAACFRAEEGEKKQLAAKIKLIEDMLDEYCQSIACEAAVIKGADHADVGRKFVDFLCEPECQQIFAKGGFMKLSEPKCFPREKKSEASE